MKQAILLAVYLTVAHISFARAGGQGRTAGSDSSLAAIPAPRQMLSEIMDVVGLKINFELKEAKVRNIQASISHRKRYILYNPEFIAWLNQTTKDKWAVMALLAHEVGHHLNGHTIRKGGSKPQLELEADEFAGFVLRKLGASLREAQEVMVFIASTNTSKTHPGRAFRMKAIQTGWNKANIAGETGLTANK